LEQLNIVGKRSGEGFVAHKAKLANALSRCMADRVTLMDFTIGRRGLLNYIKALGGSNIVKIVPAPNGKASGEQIAEKRLKVVCGANVSLIADGAWIREKTPMVFADVRVSPHNIVNPNISSVELAEALNRVLPFTSDDEKRPILQCVLVKANGGKLVLVASDGARMAIQRLDYDEGIDNACLIHKDDLKGIANALKRARRVNIGFTSSGEVALVIETEAIRYRFIGNEGTYPDYESIIPTDLNCLAHLDSIEAVKALASLKAIADNPKSFAIDLTIGEGKVLMASPDENGSSTIPADTDGKGEIRIDGKYLADVLRVCGGMVDLTLTNAYSPMMFSTDGYSCVVMPMASVKANEAQEADRKAQATAETEQPEAKAEAKKSRVKATAKA
jgi:DNA polymerase-3 subunit beta